MNTYLTFKFSMTVQHRDDHWRVRVDQLPIVVYGDTSELAEDKAVETIRLLLNRKENPRQYLESKSVECWDNDDADPQDYQVHRGLRVLEHA